MHAVDLFDDRDSPETLVKILFNKQGPLIQYPVIQYRSEFGFELLEERTDIKKYLPHIELDLDESEGQFWWVETVIESERSLKRTCRTNEQLT